MKLAVLAHQNVSEKKRLLPKNHWGDKREGGGKTYLSQGDVSTRTNEYNLSMNTRDENEQTDFNQQKNETLR